MHIIIVASIIRNILCIIYSIFYHCFQKSLFTENYFLFIAINLTTRDPLYNCLVFPIFRVSFQRNNRNKRMVQDKYSCPPKHLNNNNRTSKVLLYPFQLLHKWCSAYLHKTNTGVENMLLQGLRDLSCDL